MNYRMMLKVALKSLLRNKMRSALTCMGLVIGVGSVIAVLAIGRGALEMTRAEFAKIGHNFMGVEPNEIKLNGINGGSGQGERLTAEDGEAIKRELGHLVAGMSPVVDGWHQLVYENRNWHARVRGAGVDYPTVWHHPAGEGRFFDGEEQRLCRRVCVIGTTVRDRLFGPDADPLGRTVRIGGISFRVVGVMASNGTCAFGRDQDDAVFVPYTTFFRVLGRSESGLNSVRGIHMSLWRTEQIDEARREIDRFLRRRHSLSEDERADFLIRDTREGYAMVNGGLEIVVLLLTLFAGLALFVAGVGIMNIMLVSVTERTNEIGLRAALGARPRAILGQFVLEAVVLAAVGGGIGIPAGAGLTTLVCRTLRWPMLVDAGTVIGAFAGSLLVGFVFGYFPARRAARLDPIECLRYE